LSTQPNFTPQWKEEVIGRLAAHRSRKPSTTGQETSAHSPEAGGSRAAQAAARVAARYAKAPSYSQMQAEEARVAVRAAEIATRVALEAQAAAETVLAGLHAASQQDLSRGPAKVHSIAPQVSNAGPPPAASPERVSPRVQPGEDQQVQAQTPAALAEAAQPETAGRPLGIRWDPDLPVRPVEQKPMPRKRAQEEFELATEDWWSPAEVTENLRNNPIEIAEAKPEGANLIQFPRELVATRKMRPRSAEGYSGPVTEAEAQLSIFEVDPGPVSASPEASSEVREVPASIWNGPDWSGIQLDTLPAAIPVSSTLTDEKATPLPVAPMGVRLLAAVVDCTLILAGLVITGFLVARNFQHPPAGKVAEVLGACALALCGLLYYAFFFAFPVSTPGMRYAGIALCTFDGRRPARAQLRRRLGAMALSLLPVGLGLAWAIFDDDHLSWHDRHSQTYLRRL
jgi:uncharacterized RDD family membrane protein YckC